MDKIALLIALLTINIFFMSFLFFGYKSFFAFIMARKKTSLFPGTEGAVYRS